MDEKNAFMANIRAALGLAEVEERRPEEHPAMFAKADDTTILETIRYRTTVEKQALFTILEDNGKRINLHVDRVPSCESAAEKIVGIIRTAAPEFSNTLQVVQHDHPDIIGLQLWKRLAGAAILLHTTYPADLEVRDKTIASAIGVTAPQWAIAESASILQVTVPGQPRSTSLVPSIHIALIRIKYLLADLAELYALLRKDPPKNSYVIISGPSKTADIEAHMVHGAHGPREMYLIVIDEFMEEIPVKDAEAFFSE